MQELLIIAIGSALVNNVVLSQFLGICPFLGVSKKVETAAGMGAAVIFVITFASFVTSVIDKVLLIPLSMTYLQTIVVQVNLKAVTSLGDVTNISPQNSKSAQIILAMLPIVIVYPFLQKYFTKGIVLGSVKG